MMVVICHQRNGKPWKEGVTTWGEKVNLGLKILFKKCKYFIPICVWDGSWIEKVLFQNCTSQQFLDRNLG